jgi:magnesium chelatase subunit D
MTATRPLFPFSALVGQETMKRALLVNAVSPEIGGVLIRGEKGTAKSTAVRALAALLPDITVVTDCPYSCDPQDLAHVCASCAERAARGDTLPSLRRRVRICDLPVGATEDRVIGALDLEQALQKGERRFEPGLLAQAHRGILYIDEVNLLSHHLVDVLLDAAAAGVNTVEREGLGFSHPARFILIGTMNPEEGELRPQLLDRFGLAVDVTGVTDPEARIEVVRRWIAFEQDPRQFQQQWQTAEQAERVHLQRAHTLLPRVSVGDDMLRLIAHICLDCAVDGMRADLVIYKTARALAAYAGRMLVTLDDVRQAAELALPHRLRRQPFDQPQSDPGTLDEIIKKHTPPTTPSVAPALPSMDAATADDQSPPPVHPRPAEAQDTVFPVGAPFAIRSLTVPTRLSRSPTSDGRRDLTWSHDRRGRYVRARTPQHPLRGWHDVALDATLRAAALHQSQRRQRSGADHGAFLVSPTDLREKYRETKGGNVILFVLDASGSMGAEQRMTATKGAVLSLLLDAYQRRDHVGLIVVRGETACLALPPTGSVAVAQRLLRDVPTGGRTPLSHGLMLAATTLARYRRLEHERTPLLALVSDGRANVAMRPNDNPLTEAKMMAAEIRQLGISSIVVNTESGFLRLGLAQELADALAAKCIRLEDLAAATLKKILQQEVKMTRF